MVKIMTERSFRNQRFRARYDMNAISKNGQLIPLLYSDILRIKGKREPSS